MRTNPFYDTWLFLAGQTDPHKGSGLQYLLVILFFILVAASIYFLWKNWQLDPRQRTKEHLAIWFMRVMIGSMWFEGSLWKLPLPISGGFKYWTEQLENSAAFEFHSALVKNIYLPYIHLINPVVYLTELSLAIAFLLGFLVRPFAVIGMLFTLHLYFGLYRHPHEWPWLFIFLIFVQAFFILTNAGRSLGADALIHRNPVRPFAGDGLIARLYRKLS